MEGKHMRGKKLGIALAALAVVAAGAGALLLRPGRSADLADALSGTVVSAGAPMEGVVVTVRRSGSTIATSVVSDAQGRYRFPRGRLGVGDYAVSIKAAGFDLDNAAPISIAASQSKIADLQLVKTKDMAAQLSNTEWYMSWPGRDEDKRLARGCTHCHTYERIARSNHTADEFMQVIQRMSGYPQLAFPLKPQLLPAMRSADPPVNMESRRRLANFLATINRSSGPWKYKLKTLPRPKGRATQVIYTEYDLPEKTRQPHDVIVDSKGMVWYADFGDQILGKLDPATAKVTEYKVPLAKPGAPTGTLALRFDQDENLWLGMQFQAAISKFDQKTEKFEVYPLPPQFNAPYVQVNQVSAAHSNVDGKVWFQDAGSYRVFRLDLKTKGMEVFAPYPNIPRPNLYDVISDAQNNAYFTIFGGEEIGRIDAKTGKIQMWRTPTKRSAPRRGMLDGQGRLWFGENAGDRIGMFDPKTEQFKEWVPPTPMAWPYDVAVDSRGEVWTGGEWDDRILRLNPATGGFVQYLLPRFTNLRRTFVQNLPQGTTFWVGNTHEASIIKLEPLDSEKASAR
jgi:virginiamycin B lyase